MKENKNVQTEFCDSKFSYSEIEKSPRLSLFIREIKKIKDFRNLKILDYGCGNCFFSSYLKNILRCKNVYGTDIFEEEIEKISKEKGIKFIPLKNLNNHKFDLIILGEVIEHIVDLDEFIINIKRSLSKKSIAIISTPNLGSWFNRILIVLGMVPLYYQYSSKFVSIGHSRLSRLTNTNCNYGHIRLFTFNALREFLELYKFKVIKYYGTSVVSNRLIKPFDKTISQIFPKIAHQLVFVVENE